MGHRKHLIYALIDPRVNELRYVGRSSAGLKRPKRHWTGEIDRRDYCHNWVRSLVSVGVTPEILVLEEFEPTEDVSDRLNDAEDFWIQYFRSIGCRLTNLRQGGLNGVHSEETKRKIGERSRNISDETRRKKSESMRGKNRGPRPQWVCDKIAAAVRGRKLSEEAKRSMREKYDRTGSNNPMYGRNRSGVENPFFGRKHTPEARAKIQAAALRRWS